MYSGQMSVKLSRVSEFLATNIAGKVFLPVVYSRQMSVKSSRLGECLATHLARKGLVVVLFVDGAIALGVTKYLKKKPTQMIKRKTR